MRDTIYIREGDRLCGEYRGNWRDIIVTGVHFTDLSVIEILPIYNEYDELIGERLDVRDTILTFAEVAGIEGAKHAEFVAEDEVYWFPNDYAFDDIFGGMDPCYFDTNEVIRLSHEWNTNLFNQVHRATDEEIAEYGTND